MHALRFLTGIVVAGLTLAALALPAAPAALASASAPATAASASGCHTSYQPPDGWVVVCSNGGGSGGGGGGSGGGSGKVSCTLTKLSKAQISYLDLPKAPKGEQWDSITCPGTDPFGGVTLVSTATGAPAVTPQELLQIAEGELQVPSLKPGLAPPLDAAGALARHGLVGLPEWFWVPAAQWQPVTRYVNAGPVWAQVTATPEKLTFDPGGGLSGATCDGPGTAYAGGSGGPTACSFTYDQSSATQPGAKYAAAVTVTWDVTWTGGVALGVASVGGPLNAGLQVGYPFFQRVAEGQALVDTP